MNPNISMLIYFLCCAPCLNRIPLMTADVSGGNLQEKFSTMNYLIVTFNIVTPQKNNVTRNLWTSVVCSCRMTDFRYIVAALNCAFDSRFIVVYSNVAHVFYWHWSSVREIIRKCTFNPYSTKYVRPDFIFYEKHDIQHCWLVVALGLMDQAPMLCWLKIT